MAEQRSDGWGRVALFAVLHLLCCGSLLLLLSGVSLGFVFPQWLVVAVVLAVVGVVGFIWYLKRGCATCPRNEGRCSVERETSDQVPVDRERA